MFEWLGRLTLRVKKDRLVEVGVNARTRWAGLVLCAFALPILIFAWRLWPPLAILPSAIIFVGLLALTFRRTLVFNREEGVLRVEERLLGLGTNMLVPLFHLRAVVVEPSSEQTKWRPKADYVARIDRRVGESIHLDDSSSVGVLLNMAEAIADVAEIRLEYETRASWSKRN